MGGSMESKICTQCGASGQSGVFCTSCGKPFNEVKTFAPPPTPAPRRRKPLLIGLAAVAVVAVAGVGYFLFPRESPATPYLRQVCADLIPVNFQKTSLNDEKALVSKVRPIISSALAADPDVSAPFRNVVPQLDQMISTHESANRSMAIGIVLNSTMALNNASSELDESIRIGTELTSEIKIICKDYAQA